ncbi:hypothetical protein Kisp01_12660 [Kineosporia sp. NBRC 101677]|uniref:hypothetical protein n=1 Tax=Kineosporia sp. NBRC 101677 TaxID=3032197 RepID=UPI0024A2FF6B|nr:hypothetical protein [Kineosporia sp. NBRC 101677]GLY14250.1 hypothetical protein Kisp01_12660 [Kineosporia sp. NBRC 101677]
MPAQQPLQPLSLSQAAAATRTGDLWLFRGRSHADRAIQALTNAPVNHVGMAVVLDDLPPLMWHAELGRSLPDVWVGEHHRGAQLHDLSAAVTTWVTKYGQRAWFRQLDPEVGREAEDAVLRTVARMAGTPFPSTVGLMTRWIGSKKVVRALRRSGRTDEAVALETAYCAEVVAATYQAMGLLPDDRPPGWYDPGRFWSGDSLSLLNDHRLGNEIHVTLDSEAP